jgi:hypothetical protein
MRFVAGILAVFCLASPAYASDIQGCDTPRQLVQHETAVRQMLEGLRVGRKSEFTSLVPDGLVVESVDYAKERITARPLEAADLAKLASSNSYTLRKQETDPPYLCGAIVIKWAHRGAVEAHWMNVFEFRNGVLARATETDLVELHKQGPPKVPPLPPSH